MKFAIRELRIGKILCNAVIMPSLLILPLASCKKNSPEVYDQKISDYLAVCGRKATSIIKTTGYIDAHKKFSDKSCWKMLDRNIEDERILGIKSSIVRFGEYGYNISIMSDKGMSYSEDSIVNK